MSEGEEESTNEEFIYKPSFVLLGIDTHPSMFIKNEEGVSPFETCMLACYQLADSLIFEVNQRAWSPFSIVLAQEDLITLVEFKQNILETIKFLKCQSKLSNDDLISKYQRKGTLDIANFFLYCKKKFKEIKSLFYKRTIIFLTNDDNPTNNDTNKRFTALNEVKNFEANEIDFQMITMKHNFDYSKFYSELFSLVKNPTNDELIEDSDGLIDKLSSIIVKRYLSRKTYFFPFKGDKHRFLRVVQKKFISKPKFYNNQFVTKDGRVVKKTKEDTTVLTQYKLKNKNGDLEFDKEEYLEMKETDLNIGFTLICVSDRQTEIGFVLSAPSLLELHYTENQKFYNNFWQYCVEKEKVLICARKMKKCDNIRFVELIPKYINSNCVFLVKNIPFIEDINYPLINKTESDYSSEQFSVTSKLVQNLTCDYYPKMFCDPQMSKKKAYLKAKLLDEEMEEVEDVTADCKGIDEQVSNVSKTFKTLFYFEEEHGTKRKSTDKSKYKRKSQKYE